MQFDSGLAIMGVEHYAMLYKYNLHTCEFFARFYLILG